MNALGTPPKDMVDHVHSLGIKVGSLVGKVAHALRQKEAGVDMIVAQGAEAGEFAETSDGGRVRFCYSRRNRCDR